MIWKPRRRFVEHYIPPLPEAFKLDAAASTLAASTILSNVKSTRHTQTQTIATQRKPPNLNRNLSQSPSRSPRRRKACEDGTSARYPYSRYSNRQCPSASVVRFILL